MAKIITALTKTANGGGYYVGVTSQVKRDLPHWQLGRMLCAALPGIECKESSFGDTEFLIGQGQYDEKLWTDLAPEQLDVLLRDLGGKSPVVRVAESPAKAMVRVVALDRRANKYDIKAVGKLISEVTAKPVILGGCYNGRALEVFMPVEPAYQDLPSKQPESVISERLSYPQL